jgi:beta-xylosidase
MRGRLSLRLLTIMLVLIGAAYPSLPLAAQSSDVEGETFQNPIITTNFPDPFVLQVGDMYYAYSTNSNSRNVPLARSTDLVSWEYVRDAMPSLGPWVNLSPANVWAPEVLQVDDQYLLYYTARDRESNRQCIGLAVADSPEGPFRDRSEEPFICQVSEGGSIDASPFRDEDGALYLYWKNDGNCCMMPTYLYVQELSPDGTELVGEPVRLVRNDQAWEGSVVEAPTMWREDGNYYLFFSGNAFNGERYAVGYAVCETPLGPCEDAEENPILVSDLTKQPLVVGPGHQTVIEDAEGQTWLLYHSWQVSGAGTRTDTRQVWMDRLDWVDGRPVVQGPTREPQPAPAIGEDDTASA